MEDSSHTEQKKSGIKVNKFLIGGVLMLAAVVLLIATSLKGNAQYYLTVDELISGKVKQGSSVR
ncbi:MAG: cytochrome c maturation protein CcmE, partial [Anaerolineaceae bacterium]